MLFGIRYDLCKLYDIMELFYVRFKIVFVWSRKCFIYIIVGFKIKFCLNMQGSLIGKFKDIDVLKLLIYQVCAYKVYKFSFIILL